MNDLIAKPADSVATDQVDWIEFFKMLGKEYNLYDSTFDGQYEIRCQQCHRGSSYAGLNSLSALCGLSGRCQCGGQRKTKVIYWLEISLESKKGGSRTLALKDWVFIGHDILMPRDEYKELQRNGKLESYVKERNFYKKLE